MTGIIVAYGQPLAVGRISNAGRQVELPVVVAELPELGNKGAGVRTEYLDAVIAAVGDSEICERWRRNECDGYGPIKPAVDGTGPAEREVKGAGLGIEYLDAVVSLVGYRY